MYTIILIMKKKLAAAWGNAFFKGGVFMTGSTFIINILNYLFNSLAGRRLGPAGLSEITALFSYMAIFTIPISIFSYFVIQRIASAESPVAHARRVESYFIARCMSYWWLAPIILLLTPAIPYLTNLSMTSAIAFFPILALTYYFGLYQTFIQGMNLFTAFSLIGLVVTFLKFSGAFAVYFGGYGYIAVVVFFVVSLIAGSYLSYRVVHKYYRKTSPPAEVPHYSFGRLLRNRQFIITTISTIALSFFNNIDIVLVKKFLSAENSGLYNSWSIFSKIIFYVFGPLVAISFVYFSQGKKNSRQDAVLIYSLVAIAAAGIAAYFSYTFFAPLFINIVFGKKFLAIAPLLGRASIFGVLYSAVMYMNSYFLARRSRFALILPILMPIYILALFLSPKNIDSYVFVNIINISFTALSYLIAVGITLLPRKKHGEI